MRSVTYDGEHLIVKFYVPSYEFQSTLGIVKQCDGARFDGIRKEWRVFPTTANLDWLDKNGFTILDDAKSIWDNKPVFEVKPVELPEIDRSKLDKRLHPYQFEGVQWLEFYNGKGIIGLPVGLGKSNIAASYARLHPENRPVLVICPACVKYNWQREIKMWAKEESLILSGKTPTRLSTRYKWIIINYDILTAWADLLLEQKFKYLIGDEIHYINNKKTLRTMAFIRIARQVPKKVFLSATPIRNRPAEFFTALNLIDRQLFPNRQLYLERYCDPKYNGFSWTYKGLTNSDELFAKVKQVMYRKTKAEVLSDLPDKQHIIVPFPLDTSTQKQYDKAHASFKVWASSVEAKKKLAAKAHIETLRQLAYIGKRNGVIEWITDFLESGEKLVVFAWHTDAIDDLYNAFKDCAVVVDGHTSSKDKQKNIDAFQEKKSIKLFIGQITAAGVGINLTAASSLAIVEFPWTPGDIEQICGRIDRLTQESDKLSFFYLVGAGTVDEDTAVLLDEKGKMLDKVLDGKSDGNIFGMDIADMLTLLYRGKNDTHTD